MTTFALAADPTGAVRIERPGLSITLSLLRADILRVRILRGDEDEAASWAVPDAVRESRCVHERIVAAHAITLRTDALEVRACLARGTLDILDPMGRPILADADDAPFAAHRKAGFSVAKTLREGVAIFGLGDKPGQMNRRGRAYANWNTDSYAFEEGRDPLYKDIPFFIGFEDGRAHGVFLDNTWRTHFDFGSRDPGVIEFGAAGGPIDYYVMAGPTPADVLGAWAFLTGTPALPPKWALGYQQSRYSYRTAQEALDVARSMRAHDIPGDVIWFDLHMLDRNRSFTIDRAAFPDFAGLVAELHGLGFACVVITDFQIAQVTDEDYHPYEIGHERDAFVRRADGSVYAAKSWGGDSVFPDFSHAPARAFWGSLYRELLEAGVDGFWNDMNEPALFSDGGTFAPDVMHRVDTPSGTRLATHAELHNVYGTLNGLATREGLLGLQPDRRPFVMMRASYAGGHRHAVTWTGDNLSSWGHLRLSTPMLLSLGLGGFAFSGVNLGGFVGAPPPELLTRWLQIGMFNPIANNHSDLKTPMQEPWVHGPVHLARRRAAIVERYRLLPYLYTLAEEASRTGMPVMRPQFLEFPGTAGGQALDLAAQSQFMVGPDLLIAPEPFGEMPGPYEIILPPGQWFDYWSGARITDVRAAKITGNSGTKTQITDNAQAPHAFDHTPDPDRIAVLARAGAIIPRQPATLHTAQTPDGPLTLAIYAAPHCRGDFYDDDGLSQTPPGDMPKALRIAFTARFAKGRFHIEARVAQADYPAWWSAIRVRVFGISSFGGLDDGAAGVQARFDARSHCLTLDLVDAGGSWTISGVAALPH